MNKFMHARLTGAAALVSVLLSACGGGGGATDSTGVGVATSLVGTIAGPVGTQVVLQNNGGDNLNVTVPAFGTTSDDYNEQTFTFATTLLGGAAYQVSVLTAPANQTCSVFKGATGTMPVTSTALKIGCEYNYDLLSRSSDDSVMSYGTYNQASALGGAAGAVGSTADGYGEGRFVAFVSYAPGIATGVGGSYYQVLWRDRWTGETKLVSATAAGVEGNGNSTAPSISADGLKVAFESEATNLAGTDANGAVKDVYIWSAQDPGAGAQLVSRNEAGVQGNAASFEPAVSGDGKVVAFSTYASNLAGTVAGTTNSNVIRRDLTGNTNTLVSHANGSSSEGNFGSSRPSISEDGTRIAFWSYASNLVAGDANGLWDIFVYDTTDGLSRVSLAAGGGERNQGGDSISRIVSPTISGNGRYVAYSTTSTNVVTGDTGGFQDVFVVDTQTSGAGLNVVRASVSSAGVQGNANSPVGQGERVALSHDATWIAFNTMASNLGTTGYNVVMRNLVTGETRVVSSTSGSYTDYVSMTRTGAYVSFLTGTQGLDSRFNSSGLVARFTGVSRAWGWFD
ncbi:MAG: hypothetical protein Q7U91_14160 [Sideroxyarcus sp.]|nr:hypothetical protein [Sideroxyarcus sp.]